MPPSRLEQIGADLIDRPSDTMSDLSDVPQDFDDMELDVLDATSQVDDDQNERSDVDSDQLLHDDIENVELIRRSSSRPSSTVRTEFDTPDFSLISSGDEYQADADDDLQLSPLEMLPAELIQNIGSRANSDHDLSQLCLTSPKIASKLNPDESDIWRRRFLALYDYPFVESPYEFAIAYKLRRFVLRRFESFREIRRGKARVQLEVLTDMVLETYNRPKPYLPPPRHSKNLAAFGSPANSPWIATFIENPLYRNRFAKYGHPHNRFDTLQVVLSHLVLSQTSAVALHVRTRRDHYDLGRVYHYNRPFEVLLKPVVVEPEEPLTPSFRSSRFPNLRSPSPKTPKPQYELDMHTLLHIRNFWQRHLVDDTGGISEHTYSSMGKALLAIGKVPQKWEKPLQEHTPLNLTWYGHYSCLHPWPRSRDDLEERQTCAEDWDSIDPMTLNLETSTTNPDQSFWPPIFSTIPVFQEAIPPREYAKELHETYIRGIAPFIELGGGGKRPSLSSAEDNCTSKIPKWHPFTSSRVHGIVHDIPATSTFESKEAQEQAAENEEEPIPGWKHIMMIIYKPSTRALLSVLEHAEEDFGGTTDTDFNTADIWNPDNDATTTTTETPTNNTPSTQNQAPTIQTTDSTDATSPDQPNPTDEQIEAQLRSILARRITSFTETYTTLLTTQTTPPKQHHRHSLPSQPKTPPLPPLWSPTHIRNLEDSFSPTQYMTWDDGTIDYAYAYEGIIIPGGKIMMGRFWRIHGIEGLGSAREIGPDGVGVEVRPVQEEQQESVSSGSGEVEVEAEAEDADHEDESAGRNTESAHSKAKKRRVSRTSGPRRKAKKSRARARDNTDDDATDEDTEFEKMNENTKEEKEKETKYEFVTMLNGEESRAVNGCKGLERGPFLFWAG